MLAEHLHRVVGERERHLAPGGPQVAQQVRDPHRPVLDGRDPQAGEALEHPVADQRGERVGDAPVRERHEREGGVPERLEPAPSPLAAGPPEAAVVADAAQPGVEGEGHAGLGDAGPDRVEAGVAGRLVAAVAVGDRAGDGHEDAGAGGQHPVDLGGGPVGVGEGDHRRGVEPAVAPVEAPVVVEPAVEGGEGGVQGGHVAGQRLLHADAQRGEQQRAVHPLLVEQRQAGVALAVAGVPCDRLQLAEHGLHVEALGVAAPEVVLEAAGRGDGVEGGVGDELVDPPAHQEAPLAADVGPLHAPLGHGGVDVAGEGVLGLVVVVVRVEGPESQVHHGRSVVAARHF